MWPLTTATTVLTMTTEPASGCQATLSTSFHVVSHSSIPEGRRRGVEAFGGLGRCSASGATPARLVTAPTAHCDGDGVVGVAEVFAVRSAFLGCRRLAQRCTCTPRCAGSSFGTEPRPRTPTLQPTTPKQPPWSKKLTVVGIFLGGVRCRRRVDLRVGRRRYLIGAGDGQVGDHGDDHDGEQDGGGGGAELQPAGVAVLGQEVS